MAASSANATTTPWRKLRQSRRTEHPCTPVGRRKSARRRDPKGNTAMNDLLGIPMGTMLNALLALLTLCLLSVAWVAWRRPVIFKLGVRNIPRRRAQTTLIVAGLMLSTLIIAAALGTGDTVNHSVTGDVYANLGQVDELIVASHDGEAHTDLIATLPLDPTALMLVDQA